jgi:hypothetical protein
MSFDLEFISYNGKPSPTMDALTKWPEEMQPNITIEKKGEDGKLSYHNDDTGVHFTIYRSPEVLHLNINYCRPPFLGFFGFPVFGAVLVFIFANFKFLVEFWEFSV